MERINGCDRYGSDTNVFIISLIRAVQQGWIPPKTVTIEQHSFYRDKSRKEPNSRDPMIAFVGHGCCFSGVFFGGIARMKKGGPVTNYKAMEAHRSLLAQKPLLAGVELLIRDYRKGFWGPQQPDVIYADPPYANTSAVGSDRQTKTSFDSDEFWQWCQKQAAAGSVVLVSEYTCPIKSAELIWQQTYTKSLRSSDGIATKTECLFLISPPRRPQIGLGL